ncbi:MAG TPA: hypothetical protein VGY58_11960 [Gemmataceae bacterium]|nr:hypothetical protein [Gemmataceae bacterium]
MPSTRPASITVIAILQLIFGGITVLMYVCGGLIALASPMMAGMKAQGQKNNQPEAAVTVAEGVAKAMADLPGASVLRYVNYAVNGFLTLAMIVGGIGLLRMRNWARVLTILYGVVSVADKLFDLIYSLKYEIPATRAFLETVHAASDEDKFMVSLLEVGVRLGPVIPVVLMVYPMIVLACMLKRSNRAAFQSPGPITAVPAAGEEFEQHDRWGQG